MSIAHLPQQKTPFELAAVYNKTIADARPSFLLKEAILYFLNVFLWNITLKRFVFVINLFMIQLQDLAKWTTALVISCWSSEMLVMRRLLQHPYCSRALFCSWSGWTSPWSSLIVASCSATLFYKTWISSCRPETLWTMLLLTVVKSWVNLGIVQALKEGQLKRGWHMVMIWVSLSSWPQWTLCLPDLTSWHFAWINEWPGSSLLLLRCPCWLKITYPDWFFVNQRWKTW